ncbi:5-formyltetrahydrofolate cyclo-ligase [Penicillium longicatenatum]|uniref:5-formyltetrahydrofolate cyclo-ligase n=1 Tax=Penicillium longicatenatum TaxID=1561947 RepID=UPI002548C3FF|nr:5-formyltetrahydrofolate cyclo-ligase [Penicillium longicatenatum]KAJ5651524.1 5-formyltetrahydrofolate cyclo-ligase [Penicillium longicatenatum]
MAFQTAKRDLRKRMRETLQKMPASLINQQSGVATSKFLSLPEYQNAKSIAVYLSMPTGELSTSRIVQDAFARGKNVYIPYIHTVEKTSVMDMLALESMTEYESLLPDKWGIPSLQPVQVPGRHNGLAENGLDLIVMPGMAFDRGFRRLGHGKGYYDHFLTRYSQLSKQMPFLVALSLQEQMVEEIPVMAHDWRVDALVMGDGEYLNRQIEIEQD